MTKTKINSFWSKIIFNKEEIEKQKKIMSGDLPYPCGEYCSCDCDGKHRRPIEFSPLFDENDPNDPKHRVAIFGG